MKKFSRLSLSRSINFPVAFILIILLLSATKTYAQAGTIKGSIVDAKTQEPLIGASVLVEGSTNGAATDLDGNYIIRNLPAGNVKLSVSYVAYKPVTKTDVRVENNKDVVVNFALESDDYALQEVEVVAKANKESENILLLEQKKALVATQAVGARELSRKGIGNAEAAVAQVSGISKQEGVKNVFVRGLGDRYNATMLNGFPIPSEDPEYKNIALEFFGTDIIQNISVNKVFSSDGYGDAGGAIINISSKELVGKQELNLDVSAGFNTKTISQEFLKLDGVNYWGISKNTQPGEDYKTVFGFTNSLDPGKISLPLNHSYGISGGKSYNIGRNNNPLSFYFVGSYSNGYSYTHEKVVNTTSTGEIVQDLNGHKYSENINQMVLGNINLGLNKKHNLAYNLMLVHDNAQYVGDYVGTNSEFVSSIQPDQYETQGFLRRQQSNDNLLITNQLTSNWTLSKRLKMDAGVSHNYVKGLEPDRRENNLFRKSETEYGLLSGSGVQVRNFTALTENDFNTKLNFTYDLAKKFTGDISAVQLGYNGRFVYDNFAETEYTMTAVNTDGITLDNLNLDNLYNQQNLTNGLFEEYNKIVSTYSVKKFINSGYANISYQFNPKLTANIGTRLDKVYLQINYDINSGNVANDSKKLTPFYVLPSLNMKYDLNDKNSLRLGLSKSYTLPQSKEISPYQYIGMNFKSQGNQNLNPSDNYNADLKWDYYLSPSELISVTGFYKHIKNPIARIEVGNAGGYLTYRNISNYASVAGIELEIRKNIFNKVNSLAERVNKLTVGLSSSYIYSDLKVQNIENTPDKNSQLEGAAPFIVNADISHTYTHKNKSFTNSLVLNYFSDRVYTIGTQGFQDIIEKGIPTLHFVSISKLNNHLGLKFKANNILDPTFRLTRKGNNGGDKIVLSEYNKGIDLSLGITYEF